MKKIDQDEKLVFWGDSTSESGIRGAMENLPVEPRPTAILCMNNLMVLGTLHAIRNIGLNCPNDISVVGFDDHFWADIFIPPLTVIAQPTLEMGKTVAELLHQYILNDAPETTSQRINLKATLIVRGSCSPACNQRFSQEGELQKNENSN